MLGGHARVADVNLELGVIYLGPTSLAATAVRRSARCPWSGR